LNYSIKIPKNFAITGNFSDGIDFWVRHNTSPNNSKSFSTLLISRMENPYHQWKQQKEKEGYSGGLTPYDFFKDMVNIDVGMELVA
jgi:hypothetical protein